MIRISREQGIYLFSVLLLKLVTLLSTNDVTSTLPAWVNLNFSVSLASVHLVRLCVVTISSPSENNKQCYFSAISFFSFKVK